MRDTFRLIVIATLFLIIAFPLKAEQKRDINIESKILEERIKNNEDKTNLQLKLLEKELSLRAEDLEKRMNLYLLFVAAIFALITFLGYKTVERWIRQAIRDKTEEEIKKFEGLLRKKAEDTIKAFLLELENKAKGKISEIEELKRLYEESLNKLKAENTDISKPLSENTVKDLKDFTEKLVQAKMEEKYSFDDWYYKGVSELENKDNDKALHSFTKALERNPKSSVAYFMRGLTYARLTHYEKAVEDYNKAIDLNPKEATTYNNRGVAYCNLEQYEKAAESYNEAIKLDPKGVLPFQNLTEVQILMGNYKDALSTITAAESLSPDPKDISVSVYLMCITKKLLDMDTSECVARLNDILKTVSIFTWSFYEIEFWLKEVGISEDKKRFIAEITNMLKERGR